MPFWDSTNDSKPQVSTNQHDTCNAIDTTQTQDTTIIDSTYIEQLLPIDNEVKVTEIRSYPDTKLFVKGNKITINYWLIFEGDYNKVNDVVVVSTNKNFNIIKMEDFILHDKKFAVSHNNVRFSLEIDSSKSGEYNYGFFIKTGKGWTNKVQDRIIIF